LNSTDFGTTEDQVDALIKKHEAFDKVMEVQEEKVTFYCNMFKHFIIVIRVFASF